MTCRTQSTQPDDWLPWESEGEMYSDMEEFGAGAEFLLWGDYDTPELNERARNQKENG